jgi:hypothetical protein
MLLVLIPAPEPANHEIGISEVRVHARGKVNSHAEWLCLDELLERETSWRNRNKPWLAVNRSSGAYGLPQALPAKKMRVAGSDYRTNPKTQINWLMDFYLPERYENSACKALAHHDRKGWY